MTDSLFVVEYFESNKGISDKFRAKEIPMPMDKPKQEEVERAMRNNGAHIYRVVKWYPKKEKVSQ